MCSGCVFLNIILNSIFFLSLLFTLPSRCYDILQKTSRHVPATPAPESRAGGRVEGCRDTSNDPVGDSVNRRVCDSTGRMGT